MARGGLVEAEGGGQHQQLVRDYSGGVTFSVAVTCLMAASCGLIFGYDVGITGGVTQMESFLKKFFPEVLRGMKTAKRDAYCKYNNQLLTAFTSSMYIAGMLASLVASSVTKRVGRKAVMLIGGVMFLAGSIINAGAVNITMLIIGRILLGFGVGFTAQAAPLYLAETSPTRRRGAFTTAYHFFIIAGTLAATITNYFTNRISNWGWRVSLGLAAVPATVIILGALFVSDTPSSLMLRGEPDKARASLQRVRGAGADVDAELKDIACAVEEARRNEDGAFKRLCGKGYRHYMVMVVALPTFFDFTGMVVISVFSPLLFRTVGFDSQKAIFGAVIISLVSLSGVILSTFVVDRCGRRFLLLAGGTTMLLFQVAVTWIMADHLGKHHAVTMPKNYAVGVVVLMCLYTFTFSVSWGPLKWVVPSEIYPVDIRSAGQAITLSIALALTFAQTQVFISMLCAMKYAIFLFYAGWVVAMTVFIAVFLPETKGVPLEAMRSVWAMHWFWRRVVVVDTKQEVQLNSTTM
ncbi:hypothetical protein U9M48_032765 [Paspalum notatum var. saurae]|uniref:Major facilitator superfamily (MFS) profile domain-containing protein n=1 Tax=Paspalum notatum var. saurae TaxID=547442 RepID=A0AAQ3U9Y3_PASNO